MTERLTPCPFCGQEQDNPIEAGHADDCYFTLHARLQREMKEADCSSVPDVLAAWNRRALPEKLHTFLNAAAGEGFVLNGVDAADLYVKLFPERYATAVTEIDTGA